MFTKVISTILISPIFILSQFFDFVKPEVYKAPENKITAKKETILATTTKESIPSKATTTTKISTKKATTTKEIVKENPKKIQNIQIPAPDFEKINSDSRKTIVNIFCTTKNNELSPISGTGVIVSGDGLILTNAHIGQYFLLKDFREKDYLKCVGRTGSPAYPKYNLELVYISEDWVKENKTLLKDQNPKGTGEKDFAFLRITGPIGTTNKIEPFFYIEPNPREEIYLNEPVLLASYPAGFLGGLSIIQNLNIASSITNIQDVFTFKDGYIDIISVGGTIVSQKGSSGGLVVDRNTSLIGIITTSSEGNTTSSRGLNAITLAHINRSLEAESKLSLSEFLKIDHETYAKNFSTAKAPALTKLITDELLKTN